MREVTLEGVSVIRREVNATDGGASFAAGLKDALALSLSTALTDAEADQVAQCPSVAHAAAAVLAGRGFTVYASTSTDGPEYERRHTVLITPPPPNPATEPATEPASASPVDVDGRSRQTEVTLSGGGGLAGVSTYVVSTVDQHTWERPDDPTSTPFERRRQMTNTLTRLDAKAMTSTDAALRLVADNTTSAIAGAHLSVLLPAWWADRLSEGHTPDTAALMVNLILPPSLTNQVEFTASGRPTMRGFTLLA